MEPQKASRIQVRLKVPHPSISILRNTYLCENVGLAGETPSGQPFYFDAGENCGFDAACVNPSPRKGRTECPWSIGQLASANSEQMLRLRARDVFAALSQWIGFE